MFKAQFDLLDALDSKDCNILASCGVMRVQKRDWAMCKVNKHENLYILNGSTVRMRAKPIWILIVHGGAITRDGATNVAISSGVDKLKVEFE